MVGVVEMEAWTALVENAVLTAGAGGPQTNAAMAEQNRGTDRIASLGKWVEALRPGSSEAVLDSSETFRYPLASSQSGGTRCVAEIKLRNPPASLRSSGGESFGGRDYLLGRGRSLGRKGKTSSSE